MLPMENFYCEQLSNKKLKFPAVPLFQAQFLSISQPFGVLGGGYFLDVVR